MRKWIWSAALAAVAAVIYGPLVPAARAGDDWEWWIETPVSVKLNSNVKADIPGLCRFMNDMKDFYYRSFIVGGYYSLASWMEAGGHYWYKESRKSLQDEWVDANIAVARLNFKYSPASWLALKENNRLEFDFSIDRFTLRLKPIAEFPLGWAGLDPVKLFLDNEFFLTFDFPDDRSTFSENRATVGAEVQIAGPAAVILGYRNVGKKSAADGSWTFANVLLTSIKLAF
ncbi:MAG: DUF2490 domain-containing protein [Candidatus Aureabacteria bacterium]|nr:DUF2490 domain-containing protein [Candidatus Auribacterota bacterium]